MIHSVTAKKGTFSRVVPFFEGLNLVVAERSTEAADTDSRNGLGKTTLFQIIDYCLGSRPNDKNTLPVKWLPEWEFAVELDIRGQRVKVVRTADIPKDIMVIGDVSSWPIPPDFLPLAGVSVYTVDQWLSILGWALFDLPNVEMNKTAELPMPSARTLIHFFIRQSFADPLLPIAVQKTEELAIAYLLGLNWEYVSRIGGVKKVEKEANTIKAAAKLDLRKWQKTEKVLRAECNYLQSQMEEIKKHLADFNVLPGYAEIEERVNNLTVEIHGLKNKVVVEQSRLNAAKRQLDRANEALVPVEELYAECEFVFPDVVKQCIENVRKFHEAVTGNRRIILEREVRLLKKSIAAANERVLHLSKEKCSAMQILKTGGALEEYTKLNQRYADLARDLQSKLDCLQHLSEAQGCLDTLQDKKVEIANEARLEYEELRPIWDEAERYFDALAHEFYQTAGTLGIEMKAEKKTWGFKFDPHIQSDGSMGIKKIKIFSFDMTLFHQQRVCQHPIDFLIHDSEVCDSTDPRQLAKAFLAADRISRELHGQYICAINSDKLDAEEFKAIMPRESSRGFTRLTLSDESDETKLLGISFGPPANEPTEGQAESEQQQTGEETAEEGGDTPVDTP